MTNKKIIGLPTLVTDRLRIVLDSNLRRYYGIDATGTVCMQACDHEICLYSGNLPDEDTLTKRISIGRFNLPSVWAKRNHIHAGSYVFLLATDEGLRIYPAALEAQNG